MKFEKFDDFRAQLIRQLSGTNCLNALLSILMLKRLLFITGLRIFGDIYVFTSLNCVIGLNCG